ncbi:hypothetical protein LguiB_002659 [Lonicera macranthoides]
MQFGYLISESLTATRWRGGFVSALFFLARGYGCKILMDILEEYNQLSHHIIPLPRTEGEQGMGCMYHLFPFYNLVRFT